MKLPKDIEIALGILTPEEQMARYVQEIKKAYKLDLEQIRNAVKELTSLAVELQAVGAKE